MKTITIFNLAGVALCLAGLFTDNLVEKLLCLLIAAMFMCISGVISAIKALEQST